MTRFGEKLDALGATAALLRAFDARPLASAITGTRGRATTVVASGGSAIAAVYLARCRETLFGERTSVVTPMEIVLGGGDMADESVWIVSAGADNADTVAAVLAAKDRGASGITVVTRNPSGAALAPLGDRGAVHVVPVADEKDGFLATHSLVATVGALLAASDLASDDGIGEALIEAWVAAVRKAASQQSRAAHRATFARLRPDDTILLAADPRARAVAMLIETSAWEASLCAVQRTDLRNLAHGRHAWLHHRPERVHLMGVTGTGSRGIWSRVDALVPTDVRRTVADLGDCGRFRNAVGVVDALGMIEGMGAAVGIDPGRPGIGEFGRALYADPSLLELTRGLTPCVREKRDALAARDDPEGTEVDPVAADAARRSALESTPVGGIVLDYDGTVVTTEDRFDPPRQDIINELVRLHAAGVLIGIATGRGGSAGEDLRRALPERMHRDVVMGYYNGGHLVRLDVDIASTPPSTDPAIAAVAAWLHHHGGLPATCKWKPSGVQITISTEHLTGGDPLAARIAALPELRNGSLRLTRSAHSIDVVVASASKLRVVAELEAGIAPRHQVLTIGDSGARAGNDCELLSRSSGISVGAVCGRLGGSHSLFGRWTRGPEALVNVLMSIKRSTKGEMRLSLDAPALDKLDR